MTDETPPTQPSAGQPERSWAPETGSPEPPSTPTWAEPPAEDGSDEPEYDAWLDAQDLPAEPGHSAEAAAAAPQPVVPEGSSPGELEQEAYEEQAEGQVSDEPGADEPDDEVDDEPRPDEARYGESAASAESTPEPVAVEAEPAEVVEQTPTRVQEESAAGTDASTDAATATATAADTDAAAATDAGADATAEASTDGTTTHDAAEDERATESSTDEDLPTEPAAATEVEPAEVEAPVVVPDALEAAATPLEIEPEPAPSPPAVPEQPTAADPAPAPEAVAVEEDQAPAVPASRSGVPLVAPLAVLVWLLVATTVVLAVWSSGTRNGGATERARRDALAAARNASRLLFSYDYRHLDKDFAAGRAVTTGTFATDYQRTTTKIVSDVAPRYKAVVVADVSDAGVVTATASTVQVLVFVNQSSTSSLASGQKVTQSRLTMTLVKKHGTWLVSKVNAF